MGSDAKVWYCYEVQAWMGEVPGGAVVVRDGHRVQAPGCYACAHGGERHDVCRGCHEAPVEPDMGRIAIGERCECGHAEEDHDYSPLGGTCYAASGCQCYCYRSARVAGGARLPLGREVTECPPTQERDR
jgi:hypothetical protein